MKKFQKLIHSLLLITTPALFAHPYDMQESTVSVQEEVAVPTLSYDSVLKLLEQVESGEIEKNATPEELERIEQFVVHLAKEGVLPDNSEESLSLDDDIEELLYGEDESFAFAIGSSGAYMVVPAVFHGDMKVILCKSWVAKKWKQVKKFVKKHKKAILIGAAVVVGAAIVIAAVVVAAPAAGAAAAGAAGAAGAAAAESEKEDDEEDTVDYTPAEMKAEAPQLQAALGEQISNFKENIASEQFFQSNPSQGLSWEEKARILGSLFAHQSYLSLEQQIYSNPILFQEVQNLGVQYSILSPIGSEGHSEIDNRFSTDYGHLYANPSGADFNTLSYHLRGERALAFGYYDQAIQDLGKVIEANPTNPIPYIERGVAHFGAGQYDHSLEDYKQFTAQVQPLSVTDFSLGFAKGLPRGVYESGEGLLLFLADFATHPIQTSSQMIDAVGTLVNLARNDEWGIIAESLSPEMHELVTQWDTLPSDKRGELAGYAVGKHGADILAPGAILKIATKSVKSAQELIAVCKNIQIAQETLVLEAAAGIGDAGKIGEVVRNGQTMAFLGEELGFSAQEMGQLKQAGQLEATVKNTLDHLSLPMQESIKLFEEAGNKLKP